jgi:hypothetical protein
MPHILPDPLEKSLTSVPRVSEDAAQFHAQDVKGATLPQQFD